jgi:hypothetical protein
MSPLTLQEVIDRINQAHSPAPAHSLAKGQPATVDYVKEQKHRPEVYIPRITRLLARLIFTTLT